MKKHATTGQELLVTEISLFGRKYTVVCDQQCQKAWGINGGRPQLQLSDDMDDFVLLADHEVGNAPLQSRFVEGGDAKPYRPASHNKWCARECERSMVCKRSEPLQCWDFSHRIFNDIEKFPLNHYLTVSE